MCPLLPVAIVRASANTGSRLEIARLRVLIANEDAAQRELLWELVVGLGHEAIASAGEIESVGVVIADVDPDVALVRCDPSAEHALSLIDQILQESVCPVIAILASAEPAAVREVASRGVFACIANTSSPTLPDAIDIALQRFTEYHSIRGAFGRRMVIERATGLLMDRRGVDAETAHELLREQSRGSGETLADCAAALLTSLPANPAGTQPSED
jgi:AmiR/NasT family two-component response regulator